MSGADGRIWQVADDPVAAAADALTRCLAAAGPAPRLAIAGGSAAAILGPLRERLGAIAWGRLRVTWVDERRVPWASPDSNRGTAHRAGWLGPAAPVAHELPLWLDAETAADAVIRVEHALAQAFDGGLDVLLLGMGEDGHVASLFPGHPALAVERPVVCLDDAPKPPPERITLGLPLLAAASAAVLVATGGGKRDALGRLRDGDPALPATRLGRLEVITDQRV